MAKNVVSARARPNPAGGPLVRDFVVVLTFCMPDCGNTTSDISNVVTGDHCGTKCVGDPNEICGGSNSLSLYWNGLALQPDPTFVQKVGKWSLVGCFK
jgi:hypothetical protein